jgi:hypothetical protein
MHTLCAPVVPLLVAFLPTVAYGDEFSINKKNREHPVKKKTGNNYGTFRERSGNTQGIISES